MIGGSFFFRIGIASTLDEEDGFSVVGNLSHSGRIQTVVNERRPAVAVVLDDSDPLPSVRALANSTPQPRVLVVTPPGKRAGGKTSRMHVPGIAVSRTEMETLIPAIRLVRSGYQVTTAPPVRSEPTPASAQQPDDVWKRFDQLTARETEVVHLVLYGWSNAQIAEALELSGATVKSHVHSLMGKLELRNRMDVITTAYRTGLVRPGGPRLTWHPRPAGNAA
ncbi:response regulator transcription factor [Streptomyces sp. TBY4]|uniref:LuxR C-terminal-related transcriptional regulator n=1 Tax=Streptomyces sp. TBY4 TaxID=2962030 RepID=UPI0020B6E122|nr:response regulator transcription factor [Streptomyces sp. TBY4]MCP3760586.1 response regulator transcription factor [Streptomyces sp. TBY4]